MTTYLDFMMFLLFVLIPTLVTSNPQDNVLTGVLPDTTLGGGHLTGVTESVFTGMGASGAFTETVEVTPTSSTETTHPVPSFSSRSVPVMMHTEDATEQLQQPTSNAPPVPDPMSTYTTGKLGSGCTRKAAATKRWYGVEISDESTDRDQEGVAYAWPVRCGPPNPIQPVRYCFKDERSAKNLDDIVNHAIARWAPAMQNHVSVLSIDLDFGNDIHVYCEDDRVSNDALVISDETHDNDDDYNWNMCSTQSTTGYDYESDLKGRHTLEFCHLIPGHYDETRPWAIRAMMHELGHVIGLSHEHQRPDRNDYLWFKPKNLVGYDDAVKKADIDEQCLFEDDDTLATRIKLMSNDPDFAKYYFPQALPWARGNLYIDEKWKHHVRSTTFDYDSIMIYNSDSNTIASNKYVIWRKDSPAGEQRPVWMGGDKDPDKAQISRGDVARVAQLYPSGTDEGEQAKDLQAWGPIEGVPNPPVLKVKIRDAFETFIFAHNTTVGY